MKRPNAVGHLLRELASCQDTATDLFVEIDVRLNSSAGILVRVQHPNLLLHDVANDFDRGKKVRIIRYNDRYIIEVKMSVIEQLHSKIDVRTFFFSFDNINIFQNLSCTVGNGVCQSHSYGMSKIMTVNNLSAWKR